MTGGVYFFQKMLLLTVYFGIKSVQFGSVEKKKRACSLAPERTIHRASILLPQNLRESVTQSQVSLTNAQVSLIK